MIRRIQLTLRPSEALAALTALHAPPGDVPAAPGASAAAAVFGQRLGQEVARAFDAHARSLDALGQCLDWLERRGLCDVDRPRARAGVREPTWRSPAEVKLDVRALCRDLAAERDDPDSKARASAWAVRAVLRHLAGASLHACEVKVGNERIPAAEALAAYDTELAQAGYGPHAAPPARLAHLAKGARRKDDAPEAPGGAPAVKAEVKREAKVDAPATKRVPEVKTAPEAKREVKAAPEVKRAPEVKAEAPKRGRAKEKPFAAGFGGLPDDAMPEDRRTGDVFGPRGLTLDAEFFLTEAAIAQWPCDATSLERGRRAVVTRLHPDRAGEASAAAFHRAIKGHAELVKKLPAAPPATATVGVAAATQTAPKPEVKPEVKPEAPVAAPPVVTAVEAPAAPAKPARRASPRKRADATATATVTGEHPRATTPPPAPTRPADANSATRSTVRPIEPARATTFEWPPRPAEVEVPRARTA
ncbi:MAG: hypothetical protein U0324_21855 [Polyangiales bacterium]